MAKISDELREFADAEVLSAIQISDLKHMAKRIDAEMVELPKDKDGATIRVGDTVYDENGMACEVVSFSFGRWSEGMTVHAIDGSSQWRDLMPGKLTRTIHDSLERIADELDEMVDTASHADDTCEKLSDLAGRIRKLAAKEG